MQFTAAQKDLATVLARCQGVANAKSTMPILSNVMLTAEAGALGSTVRIAASNLRQSVTGSMPADVTRPGAIALDAKGLLERVRQMPDGPVTLALTGNAVKLTAKGSARKYTMSGLPAEDFPTLAMPDAAATWVTWQATTLSQLIASTHFSISIDDTRAHMAGALLECSGEVAKMVSTDGHRMSVATLPHPGAATSMLIPRAAVAELRKLVDEMGGTVDVTVNGYEMWARAGSLTLGVRLSDGQFPPYQQVIPSPRAEVASVARLALVGALKAVALAAAETKSVAAGIVMSLSGEVLRVSAASPDRGEAGDEVPCAYNGPDRRVGCNAKYLLDWLVAATGENVTLSLDGELDPIVMVADGATGIVMPSRI